MMAPKAAAVGKAIALAAAVIAAGAWTVSAWLETVSKAPAATGADLVQAALNRGKPAVVEFGSTRCIGCREMHKIMGELIRDHGGKVSVVTIDLLADREYARRYNIQMIPTQVFFDAEGRETGRNVGVLDAESILARLGASTGAPKP